MHATIDVLEAAGSTSPWATPMLLFPALQPLFDSSCTSSARRTGVKPGNFLSLLISHSRHDELLTEEEIFYQAYFFILAGFNTSSDALSYTMYHLAGHPDKLKAAHKEVDAKGPDFTPTLEDLENFPYLEACLRESLCLYPPVPATKRYAQDRMALGPFNVAPGNLLCGATFTLHHDDGLWEKPYNFTPERFMDTAEVPGIKRGSLNTFGQGMRSCIGQNFAIMEMKITMICLLQAYTFTLAPNQIPLAIETKSFPTIAAQIRFRLPFKTAYILQSCLQTSRALASQGAGHQSPHDVAPGQTVTIRERGPCWASSVYGFERLWARMVRWLHQRSHPVATMLNALKAMKVAYMAISHVAAEVQAQHNDLEEDSAAAEVGLSKNFCLLPPTFSKLA
ncbi:hypothetical protein WJX74_006682 [Apatococcus lobatus]|uniref:Cytochrome P450 n=1 Tax=Apatococcus lobatus TaxID=904363 RepID=A0AAW1R2I9_9CHLO